MTKTSITSFAQQINQPLTKNQITVLQINLGRKCNLACNHCHVEASPIRTEELSPEICQQLIEVINRFPQIRTVDLTGGAPEMNYGFRPLVEAAKAQGKEVIVRSNLTIFFEPGFADLPEYFARHQLRVTASLPCYLEDNVDQQRGAGVYNKSIQAIQQLNRLGYGDDPNLVIDLVYNPPLPTTNNFSLTPNQQKLEQDYKAYLAEQFQIQFNHLFTITNIPIGRTKKFLQRRAIHDDYLQFLVENYNPATLPSLMCRQELSIDYLGNVYDCDFNQMENIAATTGDLDRPKGLASLRAPRTSKADRLTVAKLLSLDNLDVIQEIKTANYCYGCTAGTGSSCGGSLV